MVAFHSPHLLSLLLVLVIGAESSSRATESIARADYIIDTWGIEDGLPNNTISSIAQTPDGYLWCGTYDGLVRFDGMRFVRIGPDDPVHQQANRVQCLLVDHQGRLWLGTDGAGVFTYSGGRLSPYFQQGDPSLDSVRCLAENSTGDIWIGTRGGVGQLQKGAVTWFTEASGFNNGARSTWNILFDRDEKLWIADWNGLKTFSEGQFHSGLTRAELRPPIRALYRDSTGSLWAGMMGKALTRDARGAWTQVDDQGQFAASEVVAFCETRAGQFWLGTRKALFRKEQNRWIAMTAKDGLASSEVRALFEDREGNLWIGTGAGGLARIKPRLVQTYSAESGLSDGPVLALAERQGRSGLCVGLEDGRLLEGAPGEFRQVAGLPADAPIKTLLHARDDALWVGTFGNGLFRIQQEKISRFAPSVGSPARIDKVLSLLQDTSGTIWIGTFYSLYRHATNNVLQAVLVDGRELRAPVTALFQDCSGAVWAACDGLGVVRLANDRGTWLTRREGLPSHFVRAFHEDAAGRVWIGTVAGLGCWREGRLAAISKSNGLVDESISQILEDNSENLWLGSARGIMRVPLSELIAVLEGKKPSLELFAAGRGEGMISTECSGGFSPAGIKTADGRLWFPTARGLVMADPATLKRTAKVLPPAVYIEEIRVDGKPTTLPNAAPERATTEPLALDAGVHRIQFGYTGLGLTAAERVRFKYRLEGLDSQWRDAGAERTAVFPNVSSGKYKFQVAACNQDGVWKEAAAPFAFVIATPYWQTVWFRGLMGLSGVACVAGFVRVVSIRHLRRKLRKLEEAHAIEKERMRIAQDMHDELGGKLSRISFLTDLARRNLPERSTSSQQIEEVSDAAREVIQTVDEIVWAVSPRNDSVESLTHYICRHAEEFFEMTNIELELNLPQVFPAQRLSAEIRHNLFCAIKEALNNVLKHAAATKVIVSIAVREASFEVAISDNGIGFDGPGLLPADRLAPSPLVASRMGNGLVNMRERLSSIRGIMNMDTHAGEGTRVVFTVPLR
jgi:ligand-binding sensor domain-containing protein/signal transduction histidine kinase